jgi:hypothetical protein
MLHISLLRMINPDTGRSKASASPVPTEQDKTMICTAACYARTFALLLGIAQLSSSASADVIAPDAFGMHFHGMANGRGWPDGVEFGYLRLWDARVLWRQLEPSKGVWDFELLDRYVDEAGKRGVKVLLTLGQPPQWASLRPDAHSPYGPGASSAPRSIDEWKNYITTLVERYKGRIHAYEVWNEVNVRHFWVGDYSTLAKLEMVTVEVVKKIDPSATVLSASIQGGAFRELEAYFKAGGGRYADAISYHFYAPTEEPEELQERIRMVRAIMIRYGFGEKKLWNTEFGWLIPNSDGGYGPKPKPVTKNWVKTARLEAAGFVVRAYLHALNGGIRHSFWYAWDNASMGLSEDKGSRPKPAAVGFEKAREWLIGADFRGCVESAHVWRCELLRDGKQQWIVWSSKGKRFQLPLDWPVSRIVSMFDDEMQISAGSLETSFLPVLLK